MTIRVRLLIILLITALTPLLLTSLTHQVSIRIAKRHLAATTRKSLDANARLALQELHQSHVILLQRDRQLTEALLTAQAREIGHVLSASAPVGTGEPNQTDDTFGLDPNIVIEPADVHPYFQDVNNPDVAKLQVDYQKQSYFSPPFVDPNRMYPILARLSSLTGLYSRTVQQAPPGVLWITTNVENRVMTRYPASATPMPNERPPGFNARDRGNNFRPPEAFSRPPQSDQTRSRRQFTNNRPPWLDPNRPRGERTRRFNRRFQRPPIPIQVDPVTQQWVMVSSTRFTSDDGSITGFTSMARTIPEVFKDLALPERWGHETEHMLIRVDPNDPNATQAERLLHDKQTQFQRPDNADRRPPWMRLRLTPLTSQNTTAFIAMMHDLIAGRAGTQLMDYNGRLSLWAYQPLDISQVAAILIVPYDRVTELAANLENSLINESLFWLQMTTGVLVLATILAVILAVIKARSLTQPIASLISAGRQLSAGNYDTQVRITTDDELGQLGRVFNGIGPKLKEREAMKESLALAGVIQQSLLPQEKPNLQHFDVAGQCLYCDETGGDYYDFIDLSDVHAHQLSVVLGDVSGHGIGAALVMAAVRGMMHSEIRHSARDLVKLLDTINQQVLEDTEVDTFVTLFHGVLDDRNGSFIWSSAGHEPAFWLHQDRNEIEELPNTGMPLGILEEAVFDQAGPIQPASGDLLVVGSDGIWEARDEHQAFFGKERFFQTLKKHAHETAEEICAAVIEQVSAFIGPGRRTDDITLIVIKTR